MELDLEKIKETEKIFNKRYGVKFDLEEFDAQLRILEEDSGGSKIPQKDWNTQYRSDFVKMMKKAFGNFVDHKIKSFDFNQMLNDFEELVMGPYRAECEKKGASAPGKKAGWNDQTFSERVKNELDTIPDHKIAYAEQRYVKKELRLRDIRAFMAKMKKNQDRSPESLSTVMCYAEAVERTIETRSIKWILGNLFKAIAERRDLKAMRRLIASTIEADRTQNPASNLREAAETLMRNDMIADTKLNVEELYEKEHFPQEQRNAERKEKVDFRSMSSAEKMIYHEAPFTAEDVLYDNLVNGLNGEYEYGTVKEKEPDFEGDSQPKIEERTSRLSL